MEEVIGEELGINTYALLYLKQITKKVLLYIYSAGNSA